MPEPQSPIVIEYTYTADVAIQAAIAVGRRIWFWVTLTYALIGAALLFWGFDDLRTLQFRPHRWLLLVGFAFVTIPLWRPFLQRYMARRHHAKLGAANKPVRWTISSDTLETKTAVGESRMTWSAIIKAVEHRDGFVLYTHPRIGQWLPKHGFKSEADITQLRALIEQRGIPGR
jgi:hypothetical protein